MLLRSKKESPLNVPDELVYCVAFEPPTTSDASSPLLSGMRTLRESRLYSSTDFFDKDTSFVDLGIGKDARGVVGIGGVQKYLVTALKPTAGTAGSDGEMVLYVTEDGATWSRALFPHGHGLKENAYTIVESTEHSILVDVNSSSGSASGTLFTSNSNGTYFVRSLEHTNRNAQGIVDFEKLVGIEGVAVVNTVENDEAVANGEEKVLRTRITFDDGAFAWFLQEVEAELVLTNRRTLELAPRAQGRQRGQEGLVRYRRHGAPLSSPVPRLSSLTAPSCSNPAPSTSTPSLSPTTLVASSPRPLLASSWASARLDRDYCLTTNAIRSSVRMRG